MTTTTEMATTTEEKYKEKEGEKGLGRKSPQKTEEGGRVRRERGGGAKRWNLPNTGIYRTVVLSDDIITKSLCSVGTATVTEEATPTAVAASSAEDASEGPVAHSNTSDLEKAIREAGIYVLAYSPCVGGTILLQMYEFAKSCLLQNFYFYCIFLLPFKNSENVVCSEMFIHCNLFFNFNHLFAAACTSSSSSEDITSLQTTTTSVATSTNSSLATHTETQSTHTTPTDNVVFPSATVTMDTGPARGPSDEETMGVKGAESPDTDDWVVLEPPT